MKLSMWMIDNMLHDCKKEVCIIDGLLQIERIQLIPFKFPVQDTNRFSNFGNDTKSNLSVLKIYHDDSLPLPHSLLKNGHDWILVYGASSLIYEQLFQTQQTYFSWEHTLIEAKLCHKSAQEIIDICEKILKSPMLLANLYGEVICISSAWPADAQVDINWQQMWESKRLPSQIMDQPIVANNTVISNFSFEPQKTNPICPGGTSVMGMYIGEKQKPLATLFLFEHDYVLGERERQLMVICADAIAFASEFSSPIGSIYSRSRCFTELLDGTSNLSNADRLLTSGLKQYDFWYIIAIHNIYRKDVLSLNTIIHTLGNLQEEYIFTSRNNVIVGLLPKDLSENFLLSFKKQFNPGIFCIGISLPFQNLDSILLHYKQALLTLDYCKHEAGVYYCKDYSFQHLLSCIDVQNQALELTHPALEILKNYDLKNGTVLYETLYCYLKEERSTVICAQKLFIHKNTMIYRIKKILSLIGNILDNANERQYILLSYYLNDMNKLK